MIMQTPTKTDSAGMNWRPANIVLLLEVMHIQRKRMQCILFQKICSLRQIWMRTVKKQKLQMHLMMSVPVYLERIHTHLMYPERTLRVRSGRHIWMMPKGLWQMNSKKNWTKASSVNIRNPMPENLGKWREMLRLQYRWTADYPWGICFMMKQETMWERCLLTIPGGKHC